MQALQIFSYQNTQVRTATVDGEPWFVAKDVCAILGYSNDRDAIKRHCREKGVVKRDTLTASGTQSLTYINEGNIYRLAAKSQLPGAEGFESWIFDEVIPSVRKTGAYVAPTAKPAALMREALGLFTASKKFAKALGLDGNRATIKAIQITREQTGVDATHLFEVAGLIAETQANYLTATEIGKRLFPAQSAIKVNKLLEEMGFQRKEDGEWVGSPEYQAHWVLIEAPRVHVVGSSLAVRWFPSIIPLIQERLSA